MHIIVGYLKKNWRSWRKRTMTLSIKRKIWRSSWGKEFKCYEKSFNFCHTKFSFTFIHYASHSFIKTLICNRPNRKDFGVSPPTNYIFPHVNFRCLATIGSLSISSASCDQLINFPSKKMFAKAKRVIGQTWKFSSKNTNLPLILPSKKKTILWPTNWRNKKEEFLPKLSRKMSTPAT